MFSMLGHFSTLAGENQTIHGLVWAVERLFCLLLFGGSSPVLDCSLHTCPDQYSVEDAREILCRSLELSVCGALFTGTLALRIFANLVSLNSELFCHLEKIPRYPVPGLGTPNGKLWQFVGLTSLFPFSQRADILQNIWPVLLKTFKAIKKRKSIRNCHIPE